MQSKNPFNPTFGNVPPLFLDKEKVTKELIAEIKEGYPQPFFITGVRGSGKTSFLTHISQILEKDPDCYCIDLINEKDILAKLVYKLYRMQHKKIQKIISDITSLSFGGITISKEKKDSDIEEILCGLMNSVQQQGKYVVIMIDEVDDSAAIQKFAQQYNNLKRKDFPVYVVMTGLPDLVLDLQNNSRLTFLLRSRKITMQPLANKDMERAYQDVFGGNFEVAHKMAKLTKGYSYGFQLLGDIYYRHLKYNDLQPNLETLDAILEEYQITLFNNAYQKIYAGISKGDREYLTAVLNHPKISETAKVLGKSINYVSQYRKRMIDRKIVQSSTYGEVGYTLPLFDEFIKQTQDPNSEFYWEV